MQDPVRYEFAPEGRITVAAGQDVLQDGPLDPATGQPGWQDALSWLRAHSELNTQFWEEGAEPGKPRPTDKEFHKLLKARSAEQDVEGVRALLAQERGTHKREALIDACLIVLTALGVEDEPAPVRVDWSAASREEMLQAAHARGLTDVPAETTDEQLRAALALLPE